MVDIPRAVLSEHLEERLHGRRVIAAVFLTFRFDPAFFEQEVLPVFMNIPVSHAPAIRLVQLEDALRLVPSGVAVYYDQNGLVPEAGPAKLDVQRIPIRHRNGIFHPKNVFVLVEDAEPDEEGYRARTLLVTCLSANLTRAGWWENVEVCHVEEIAEGDATRLRDDVLTFLRSVERRAGDRTSGHKALSTVREFVREADPRRRRSYGGALHTHFYDGGSSVADFLDDSAGHQIRDLNLEIISPYFDKGPVCAPLRELVERFNPREVRVLLPKNDLGEATCSPELFEWVRNQPGVSWGRLPSDVVRVTKRDDTANRQVHAKVYRFFSPSPKREILFIGSANLTRAGHEAAARGNVESGCLVEIDPPRRPDWWLLGESQRPKIFASKTDEASSTTGGSRLSIRYHWLRQGAEAFWDDQNDSPRLTVSAQGVRLFTLEPIPGQRWQGLSRESAAELHRVLPSTSLLTVEGEGPEPGIILVQEEGMEARPSLLRDLSPAEILRYWSLLTAAQRAQFLEAHATEALLGGEGAHLVAQHRRLIAGGTFFDRFAGIFLAFGCLERGVRQALSDGREREASYRLFGEKYDSLGTLLQRISSESAEGKGDEIEQYVIALSAQQLVRELRREFPEFWRAHEESAHLLQERLTVTDGLRNRVIARDPSEMPAFIDWFDQWFLKKAARVEVEAS